MTKIIILLQFWTSISVGVILCFFLLIILHTLDTSIGYWRLDKKVLKERRIISQYMGLTLSLQDQSTTWWFLRINLMKKKTLQILFGRSKVQSPVATTNGILFTYLFFSFHIVTFFIDGISKEGMRDCVRPWGARAPIHIKCI